MSGLELPAGFMFADEAGLDIPEGFVLAPQGGKQSMGFLDKLKNPPSGPSLIGLAKSVFEGVKSFGDAYSGENPVAAPGIRREDLTEEPGPQPIDRAIGPVFDAASVISLGSTGAPAMRGAIPRQPPAAPPLLEAAENIGVSVPRALATESGALQRMGASAVQVPFAGQPLVSAAKKTFGELDSAAKRVESDLGWGNVEFAGSKVKDDLATWVKRISSDEESLAHEAVKDMIQPNVITPLENTAKTLADINIRRANAARPESPAGGMLAEALSRPGLNYEGMKDLRSSFGPRVSRALVSQGLDDGEVKLIYGALSRDLENAVKRAGGDEAVTAWREANRQSVKIKSEKRQLAQIIGEKGDVAPERIFDRIVAMAGSNSRADIARLSLARRTIGEESWREIGSAVVAKLGRDAEGNFSPDRFVGPRGYSALSEAAKNILFDKAHKRALDDIATVSSAIKDKMSSLQNTSRTTGTLIGAVGLTGVWVEPITTLSSLVGVNVVARLLASPVQAKGVAQWAKSYQRAINAPNKSNRAMLAMASRSLAGMIGDRQLAVQLQSIVPARGDENGENVNGVRQ